jgi:hypothetical protein
LHLETQLGGFANPLDRFVQGSRLRMASGNLWDGRDVVAVLIALYEDVKFALQLVPSVFIVDRLRRPASGLVPPSGWSQKCARVFR